jgi:hypothetical protein
LVACLPLLSPLPALARPACAGPDTIKEVQLRQFHYRLQVAALNCRGDDPSLAGKWQSYVQTQAHVLAANGRALSAYFQGQAAFDRHNTIITNYESVRVHETPDFCEGMAPLFDKALEAKAGQLHQLATEAIGQPDDVRPCKEATKAKSKKKA